MGTESSDRDLTSSVPEPATGTAELPPVGSEQHPHPARRYYDTYWATEGWVLWVPDKVQELLRRHTTTEDACLDVGCGDGQSTGSWLGRHAASYTGVDVSATAVEMANARGLNARVIDDAGELPFENASFDFASCTEVLEHLFAPQRAVAEMRRVLRPGGRLLITVPNAAHWRNRIDLGLFGRWNPRGDHLSATQPWRDPHVRFFTVTSAVSLVTSCGFEVIESGGFTVFGMLYFIPGVRHLARQRQARRWGQHLAERFPGVLASNVYVVARVPPAP